MNRIHPHLGEQTKKKNKKSFNQDKYFQILKKKMRVLRREREEKWK